MLVPYVQTIDASSLNQAIAMALDVSTQEPRNLVINTGRGIALGAKTLTPYVEQETIDTELGVISTPVLASRGPRKGLPLKSGKKNIEVPEQSLAIKIVLARLHPGSNYNQLTRQRWALDRATFSPGMGNAGFWAKVQLVAQRMVSARHSSTHFLQAGWKGVYRRLTEFRYVRGLVEENFIDVDVTASTVFDDMGSATLTGNGASVSLEIANRIGMKGVNAETYNEALHQYGGPALQQAVNDRASEMQARYLPRWEAELARRWNAIP